MTAGFQLNRHRIEFTIASQEERRKKAATKRIADLSNNEKYTHTHTFNGVVMVGGGLERNDFETIEQDREEGSKTI